MALWPCSFLTTYSPNIGTPGIAILWHSTKFILTRTSLNSPSFHWPLSSGIPSQPMLQLLQVLRSLRQQLYNCSILNPRQYTAYFNMIFIILDHPSSSVFSSVFINVLPINFRKLFLFLPHFNLVLTFHLYPDWLSFIHLLFFFMTLTRSAFQKCSRGRKQYQKIDR